MQEQPVLLITFSNSLRTTIQRKFQVNETTVLEVQKE